MLSSSPQTNPAVSALALSPEDIRRLLEDGSSQTRADITDKIAGAYGDARLHERELKVAEQIFRLLVRDTEVKVRASLAQHIKSSKVIPRDIVMVLARDVEQVSLPVLEYSEVLTEQDLVEIVESTKQVSRHIAISRRREVSQLVSGALLRTDNQQVTTSLVQNKGAEIGEDDLEKIIDKNGGNEQLMEALVSRNRLPVAVVERLVTVVSGSLAEKLKEKHKILSHEVIEEQAESARESETLQLVKGVEDDEELDKLITQMMSSDRLSPSMILSALCQGNFQFFEASLARLAGIPIANARKLLKDGGDLGFRGLYNKSGLPDTMRPAVRLLFRVVRELAEEGEKPGKSRYANRVVERILKYSEESPIENLSYIIALVRRST